MTAEDGLIAAYLLDGQGGGRAVGWDAVRRGPPEEGWLWVHLDYGGAAAVKWLREEAGLDEIAVASLLAEETRPRSLAHPDALLVVLRGVNTNPGADPEDMVAVRVRVEARRVITVRHRRLLSVQDLREGIEHGAGPTSPGGFLVDLAERLAERASDVIEDLNNQVDQLEDELLDRGGYQMRSQLAALRREVILLRRYLAPQREAMVRLDNERVPLLSDLERVRLREVADAVMRQVEDLDAARDRAGVIYEELASRLSEQMNQRMYVLSIVAGIFLPLGFITGLLGVNVGGIPGSDYHWGFLVVSLLLGGLAAVQLVWFKSKHWF